MLNPLLSPNIRTPAFVYSENVLLSKLQRFSEEKVAPCSFTQLFPLKCYNGVGALNLIANHVDGFAASSLFEAKLGREVLGDKKRIHFTSPSLRPDELSSLVSLCDGIAFNSLSQWNLSKEEALGHTSCGLRINPMLPVENDLRYNPSRPHSRLGIPLTQILYALSNNHTIFDGIKGIHFHTNCDSEDWSPILQTVKHLDNQIPELLAQCKWINLGGGYLLDENTDLSPFLEARKMLQGKYGLEVIIEPGAAVVRDACYLISQVVDLVASDGVQVAILDTSVNHAPEVFEYQFTPDVMGDKENGEFIYILAGATCLAGDIFGEYGFEEPLEIGSKIVFCAMGAYTQVKAHMFNGVNLPSVYALTSEGQFRLEKEYSYEDFRSRCGAV